MSWITQHLEPLSTQFYRLSWLLLSGGVLLACMLLLLASTISVIRWQKEGNFWPSSKTTSLSTTRSTGELMLSKERTYNSSVNLMSSKTSNLKAEDTQPKMVRERMHELRSWNNNARLIGNMLPDDLEKLKRD